MSYLQAVIIGPLQGFTELFPVSSLGHSVLVPAWLGWDNLVGGQSAGESFYLAFLVGLHLATAVALLVHFRRDWAAIAAGSARSLRHRRVVDADGRLGWKLVIATIPVGVVGLAFEHSLRTLFAKPLSAATFLTVNGGILLAGELLRRRSHRDRLGRAPVTETATASVGAAVRRGRSIDQLTVADAATIGAAEVLALFSFMLATPVILAAGLYKLPDLLGPNGNGIHGQILVGSVVAGLAAYVAVRALERLFRAGTLLPFALYCLAAGGLSIVRFA